MSEKVICFITNIGSRDISIDNILPDIRNNRDKSKNVLENFDEYFKTITLPIIDKAITRVLEEHNEINYIFLVCTDQGENSSHSQTDTLYSAEVVKKFLLKKYSKQIPSANKQFKIIKIQTAPNDYDTMLEKYKGILKIENIDKLFVSVTSGTQAMNTALIFNSIDMLGSKCNIIYSSESAKRAQILNLPVIISQKQKIKEITLLIKKYDYYAAQIILNDLEMDSKKKIILQNILNYAYNRLFYNFGDAIKALDISIQNSTGNIRSELQKLLDEVYKPDIKWQIKELIYNSHIKLINGDYIDFLGRLFRYLEAISIPLIKRVGVGLNETERLSSSWIDSNPDIVKDLEDYFLMEYKNPFDRTKKINRVSSLAILKLLAKNKSELTDLVIKMEKLSLLAEKRNKSIVAHDFEPISKLLLDECFEDDISKIPQLMLELYSSAYENTEFKNPFDDINDLIIKTLD